MSDANVIAKGAARVVGAVQARMASSRLPNKALAPLRGEALLMRVLERVMAAKTIDTTVLATTTAETDEPLVAFVRARGVPAHRGPVDDLVERLLVVAEGEKADVLVRVWGDCPFVDPVLLDAGVARLLENPELDFVCTTCPSKRVFAAGIDFEVYRTTTLRRLHEASTDPFFREFPFEQVTNGPFKWEQLEAPADDSDLYLTVDWPSDLERAETIYQALYDRERPFAYAELVAFCRANPELGRSAQELARNPEYFAKKAKKQERQ